MVGLFLLLSSWINFLYPWYIVSSAYPPMISVCISFGSKIKYQNFYKTQTPILLITILSTEYNIQIPWKVHRFDFSFFFHFFSFFARACVSSFCIASEARRASYCFTYYFCLDISVFLSNNNVSTITIYCTKTIRSCRFSNKACIDAAMHVLFYYWLDYSKETFFLCLLGCYEHYLSVLLVCLCRLLFWRFKQFFIVWESYFLACSFYFGKQFLPDFQECIFKESKLNCVVNHKSHP